MWLKQKLHYTRACLSRDILTLSASATANGVAMKWQLFPKRVPPPTLQNHLRCWRPQEDYASERHGKHGFHIISIQTWLTTRRPTRTFARRLWVKKSYRPSLSIRVCSLHNCFLSTAASVVLCQTDTFNKKLLHSNLWSASLDIMAAPLCMDQQSWIWSLRLPIV